MAVDRLIWLRRNFISPQTTGPTSRRRKSPTDYCDLKIFFVAKRDFLVELISISAKQYNKQRCIKCGSL